MNVPYSVSAGGAGLPRDSLPTESLAVSALTRSYDQFGYETWRVDPPLGNVKGSLVSGWAAQPSSKSCILNVDLFSRTW